MRGPPLTRPGSLLKVIVALALVGAIGTGAVVLGRRTAGRRASGDAAARRARAARKVPLALRRIAGREGGGTVLEAIEAAGGWRAWQAHRAASFRLEGVFFGDHGEIRERKSERVTLRLDQPLRVRIEAEDGSSLIGYGSAGAWGAGRQSDGRLNPALGPGSLPRAALRDLALDAAWVFSLPFNLGDADAEFHGDSSPATGDSLIRIAVSYPPAPGDTAARVSTLGFDPESGHVLEVLFRRGAAPDSAGAGQPGAERAAARGDESADGTTAAENASAPEAAPGRFLLVLRGYTDFDGIWRPVRRAFYEADRNGRPVRRIYEQRLGEVVWDPPVTGALFEPPPAP